MCRNLRLCLQPLTCFWMLTQAARRWSRRSFSRYATCPALKKILVRPNLYWLESCNGPKRKMAEEHKLSDVQYAVYHSAFLLQEWVSAEPSCTSASSLPASAPTGSSRYCNDCRTRYTSTCKHGQRRWELYRPVMTRNITILFIRDHFNLAGCIFWWVCVFDHASDSWDFLWNLF